MSPAVYARSSILARAGAAGEPPAGRARALEDDPPGGARALRLGQRHDRPRVRALPDAQAELRLPPIRATGNRGYALYTWLQS